MICMPREISQKQMRTFNTRKNAKAACSGLKPCSREWIVIGSVVPATTYTNTTIHTRMNPEGEHFVAEGTEEEPADCFSARASCCLSVRCGCAYDDGAGERLPRFEATPGIAGNSVALQLLIHRIFLISMSCAMRVHSLFCCRRAGSAAHRSSSQEPRRICHGEGGQRERAGYFTNSQEQKCMKI
jgi:hypothetical protein